MHKELTEEEALVARAIGEARREAATRRGTFYDTNAATPEEMAPHIIAALDRYRQKRSQPLPASTAPLATRILVFGIAEGRDHANEPNWQGAWQYDKGVFTTDDPEAVTIAATHWISLPPNPTSVT